ncbi:hypothetical protein [Streptomyces sp. NPDC048057]|uniref:hypothetical protein n=1 Tax=Streptomyces sp. NPDC048057 TaxID=3155628 RepID=UPI0034021566
MGIESDQLVYDYLSRVGDLAQQRQLPSGARMELVSSLRGEIDRQRANGGGDNPASVRRILGRLGTPTEVVDAATDGSARPSSKPSAPAHEPPRHRPAPTPARERAKPPVAPPSAPEPPRVTLPGQRLRKLIPNPRKDRPAAPPVAPPEPPRQGLPPHLAGLDELGPSTGPDADGDWWSVKPEPYGAGERIAGFTGGVEIPEILRPPRKDDDPEGTEGSEEEAVEEGDAAAEPPHRRGLLSRLRRHPTDDDSPAPAAGLGNPFLLLAALLLIGGALFTSWFALGLGWLCAYASRKLTVTERKVAVIGLPATAVTAGLVWLWGRSTGRWGEALPEDALGDAIASTGPWVVRAAALASALYLVLRARRV